MWYIRDSNVNKMWIFVNFEFVRLKRTAMKKVINGAKKNKLKNSFILLWIFITILLELPTKTIVGLCWADICKFNRSSSAIHDEETKG